MPHVREADERDLRHEHPDFGEVAAGILRDQKGDAM
jgi:hypothetical protein